MALQEILTRYGFEFDGNKIKAIEKGTRRTEQVLNRSAAAAEKFNRRMSKAFSFAKRLAGAYLGLRGFQAVTGDVAGGIKKIDQAATEAGSTFEDMQDNLAIGKVAGAKFDDIVDIAKMTSVRIGEAFVEGNKDFKKKFAAMGITEEMVRDPVTKKIRSQADLLKMVQAGMGRLDKEQETLFLDVLYSDAGTRGRKFLALTKQQRAEALATAKATGLIHSKKTVAAARQYNLLKKQILLRMIGFRNLIASKVLPAMVAISRAFRDWWNEGDNAERTMMALRLAASLVAAWLVKIVAVKAAGYFKLLATAIKAAAVAMRGFGRATAFAFAKFAIIAAVITAIALAIEDLYVFLRGGDSLIGSLIGDESTANALRSVFFDVGKAFKELAATLAPIYAELWSVVGPAFKQLWQLVKPIVPWIGRALGGVLLIAIKLIEGLIIGLKYLAEAVVFSAKATAEFMGGAWIWLKELWQGFLDSIFSGLVAIQGWWRALGNGITSLWNGIVSLAKKIGAAIASPFIAAAKGVASIWNKVIGGIKAAIAKVVDTIQTAIRMKDALLGKAKIGGALSVGVQGGLPGQPTTGAPGVRTPGAGGGVVNSSATVAPGAVQVTITGVPEGAIGPTTVDEINKRLTQVITQAGNDIRKPSPGQGG